MVQALLPKWWARRRLRHAHQHEFEATGTDQIRLRVEKSIYQEDKLKSARDWL